MEPKKHNILIVEDDESIRYLIQSKLFKDGFSVSVAANGLHAMQILKSGVEFDLIISDLKMPGKTGLELLAEVKRMNITAPFVLVTGFAERPKVIAAITSGARDVLVKPIRHHELLGKIKEYLGIIDKELKEPA